MSVSFGGEFTTYLLAGFSKSLAREGRLRKQAAMRLSGGQRCPFINWLEREGRFLKRLRSDIAL